MRRTNARSLSSPHYGKQVTRILMDVQQFLGRQLFKPMFLVLVITILVPFLRFTNQVSVNKSALLLIDELTEKPMNIPSATHWVLSTNQSHITSSNVIDCIGRKGRDYFLCTVGQIANETAGIQTFHSEANDPVLLYFQGAAQFKSSPDKAAETWSTIPNISHFLARQALKFYEQGDITWSIQIAEAAVAASSESVPELASTYLALCQSFIEQYDKVQAMDFCQKAENANDSWINQINVARMYLSFQENERALNIAMLLIERGEGVVPALRIRGTAYAALGDYENALADYSQLQALSPIDRYTMYELAELYYKMNNLVQAKQIFERLQREYGDDRADGFLKAIAAQQKLKAPQ